MNLSLAHHQCSLEQENHKIRAVTTFIWKIKINTFAVTTMSVQPNVTSKNHTNIFFAVLILQFKTALHKTPVTFNSIKHFIFR